MQTPNAVLLTEDIPQNTRAHANLPADSAYPRGAWYTLQWLLNPNVEVLDLLQNNMDAAFLKRTSKPKPSELLLNYNYGAAAVKCWGKNTSVLLNRHDIPRPKAPSGSLLSPPKKSFNQTEFQAKLDARRDGREVYGAENEIQGVNDEDETREEYSEDEGQEGDDSTMDDDDIHNAIFLG